MKHVKGYRDLPLQGPVKVGDTLYLTVWAPDHSSVKLKIDGGEEYEMEPIGEGYFLRKLPFKAEFNYKYLLESGEYPDPASRYQPYGVHGPSRALDLSFKWEDHSWKGLPLEKYIIYEIHVGTFSPSGTFDGVIEKLLYLKELGITAIEIMPIAQFPGGRNWGYDGVYLYAPQNTYGGPIAFKRLVNEAHKLGLAVILDVVYNHLGPEGNYLWAYGPYFTRTYKTPWGDTFNLDGPHSPHVRAFLINNALYWIEEYHVDALRVDSVHAFYDASSKHFLAELVEAVEEKAKELGREVIIFAESDLNDPKVIRSPELGGYGFHAQWLDDFHHALHVALTGESQGYYADFNGLEDLAKALLFSYVNDGRYSKFRNRFHGAMDPSLPTKRFVVFAQNHDQVGNRAFGERLSQLAGLEGAKLGALLVILSPYIPLIFMGEEWGELNPFLYFVSHSDPNLIEAVRKGRKEEFKAFNWSKEPPDPQSVETFMRSKLSWDLRIKEPHSKIFALFRKLIELRKKYIDLLTFKRTELQAIGLSDLLILKYRLSLDKSLMIVANFSDEEREVNLGDTWKLIIDTSHDTWGGPREVNLSGDLLISKYRLYPKSGILLERISDRA